MGFSEQELEKLLARGNCRLISTAPVIDRPVKKKRTQSGFREDLGLFVRSAWEANYLRYLRWLKAGGQIQEVEYETEEFYLFRMIKGVPRDYKRGSRYYKIDFKVTNPDGSVEYHEVKGFMDNRSAVKLKRFRRCYPALRLKLIDAAAYYSIKKDFAGSLPGWE